MTLFYHLFGYLLVGMIILIGTDEYLALQAEIEQYEHGMTSSALQNGRSIGGIIAQVWKENGEQKALEYLRAAADSGNIGIHWIWVEDLRTSTPDAKKEIIEKLNLGDPVSIKMADDTGSYRLHTFVPVDVGLPATGALELIESFALLHEYTRDMLIRAVVVGFVLSLICGFILYLFIDRKVRVPLDRLMQRAKRIAEGDLEVDRGISGDDELSEMARIMNDMCSRLASAKEKIQFEYAARLKTLDQLRHTERLSTFGLIAAGIAHEIGTPLNVVDGRAKMIINEEMSGEEARECAAIIKSQADRITLIVRQLLDFTRRPKQHIVKENIALLLRQVFLLLQPMATKQRVSFSLLRADEVDVDLSVDGSQMQQVLVNLLMNSVQAMPDGGKITVTLTNESLPALGQDEGDPKKYMKIRIVDEGVGICQEDLEHIFTPFFTTKTIGTGTGLGLSIAHGIVEEHGGWIDVESSFLKGACFTVFLPMKEFKG